MIPRLVAWYEANKRDLPWRNARDPYAVWLSEIMLQQTRVNTVIPHYERFLERFPDVHTLAEAPLDHVLSAWSGLGYYRRARMLHEGAREVHARGMPRVASELRTIRGIGAYTAGAIASIAFGERAPIVDGNVARVLARVHGIKDAIDRGKGLARVWKLAGELVKDEGADAGTINQALMELGATVCTPRAPRCADCPVATLCVAKRDRKVHLLPRKTPKKAAKEWRRVAFVIRTGDRVIMGKRKTRLFGGMWEPPMVDARTPLPALAQHATVTKKSVTHVLSHRRLVIAVRAGLMGELPSLSFPSDEYECVEPIEIGEIGSLAIATLGRKLLRAGGILC